MALIEFTEKSGNPVWINDTAVEAVGVIYSDGTVTGDLPDAKPLTYVILKSGATFHLDHKTETVVGRLQPYI